MTFVVRLAQPNESDFLRLLPLLKSFSDEHQMGALSGEGFDLDKAIPEIAATVGCKTWIAENDAGVIVGSIGLQLTSSWYSTKKHYIDNWIYVLPEYRATGVAMELIKQVKEFAKTSEHSIVLALYNMEDTERKIKFFQRAGLKLAGALFYVGE